MSEPRNGGEGLIVRGQNPGGPTLHAQPASVIQPHFSPNQRAWRRFGSNRPATVSAWFLAALMFLVIAWPLGLKLVSVVGTGGQAWAQANDPDHLSDNAFQ